MDEKLGGAQVAPLAVISPVIAALRRANRRADVENWCETALARIRQEFGASQGKGGYLPFEVVCASEWLGNRKAVEYLWPLYRDHITTLGSFMIGKGCGGEAFNQFALAAQEANSAGLSELTGWVAALYLEFMQGSSSPLKTVTDAKKELLAHGNADIHAQNAKETAPKDFAAISHEIDALPEPQRESALCDLVYKCTQKHDWNHAIAALGKISGLPNPRNGKEYVRLWGQRICEAAGKPGVLSDANLADLREILKRLLSSKHTQAA